MVVYFFAKVVPVLRTSTGSKFVSFFDDLFNISPGSQAELYVSRRLKKLDSRHYFVFNDIMLPSIGNTPYSQIDHLVISRFGIFSLETKSHKGWIFGSKNNMFWTQCIYGTKYKFYNPLRQNFAHIKAIESALLQFRLNSPIHSLVVFPTASKIIVNGTNEVGDTSHALEVLLSYKDAVYSENEYYQIIQLIQAAIITDSHLRSVHNEQVNALINSRAHAQV